MGDYNGTAGKARDGRTRAGAHLLLCLATCLCAPLGAEPLKILCENDPPNQFVASDGQLAGYTIEVVREIQRRIGGDEPIQLVPWARGWEWIRTQPNVVLFQMTRTGDRNASFKWVGPVLELAFGFYARADSPIRISSLDDARKAGAIGVYRDTERDQILTKAGFTNLDRTADATGNFKKLMAGRIDLLAASVETLDELAKSVGFKADDVRLVYVFARNQTYIAMSREIPDATVARWNAALDAMKRDGTFERLFRKYYPRLPLPGPAITTF